MNSREADLVQTDLLYRRAISLEYFTVAWCVVEVIVALAAGVKAGSVALVAFGLDSSIEVIAAVSVLWRFKQRSLDAQRAEERTTKIVGATFFGLAAFVSYESVTDLYFRRAPQGSLPGIILAAAALVTMSLLGISKRNLGTKLNSRVLLADSAESLACAYFSAALLLGLVLNAWFRWWWADPAAALAIGALMVREGFETFLGGE
ncbi:MAG: cation diffusion facilitator family transporter [Terriglobia bacterium]